MSDTPTRLICVLVDSTIPAMRQSLARALQAGATAVECRLDYLDELPDEASLAALLSDASGTDVIVTCRPARQGGRYNGDERGRLELLALASRLGATWIDVEEDVPPADRPDGPTILSYHNFETCPDDLAEIVDAMEASAAAMNKVACHVAHPAEALTIADLIGRCAKPTIALAMGEAGVLSRILAGKLGGAGTFVAARSEASSAPGQPTIEDIRTLYRWQAVRAGTAVYGVIGCPVGHSMSPAIHNAAFDAAGVDGVYVPLRIEPGRENFDRFMDAILARPAMGWRGLSVTIPHKENALAYLGADACDPQGVTIGAINTITIDPDGRLWGDNTDYAAAIDAVCNAMGIQRADLAGKAVAVLGAGGASRAIVAALAHYGAQTTIYNRTLSRAQALAEEFGAQALPMDRADDLQATIVINCTPIGMHPHVDASPMSRLPSCVEVVFDTIYNPLETRLLSMARQAGCLTVSGVDMFVNQAVAQFERWTAREAPQEVMRQVVLDRLGGRT
jgi:3-dehydroquinate dehydratase/shikimate dehydrogenase